MTAGKETAWIASGFLGIVAASIFLQSFILMNPDVALHLDVARRILAGERLYEDMLIVNFPLQFYLRIIPALLTQYTGLPLIMASHVFNITLAVLLYGFTVFLMKDTLESPARRIAFSLMLAFVFFLLPLSGRNEFGQKEHLFLLFAFPYFALCCRTLKGLPRGTVSPMIAGLMMGIGCCIKPHFLLFPIASELFLMWRPRSVLVWLRVETCMIAVAGVLYMLLLFPVWERYVHTMVPLLPFYSAIGHNWVFLLLMTVLKAGPILLLLLIFWKRVIQNERQLYLTILFLAGTIVALVQQKGWEYHFLPALGLGLMMLADMVASSSIQKGSKKHLQENRVLLIYSGLILLWLAGGIPLTTARDEVRKRGMVDALGAVIDHYAADKIYILSDHIKYAFPLVLLKELSWQYSFYHLWPITGFLNFSQVNGTLTELEKTKLGDIKRFVSERIAADVKHAQPQLIVVAVNEPDPVTGKPLDYMAYLAAYSSFAEITQHYGLQAEVKDSQDNLRFKIYVRESMP